MGKQKAVSILVTLVLLVAAGAAFALWPKHYTVGQRISGTAVFWNDREAFLFLSGKQATEDWISVEARKAPPHDPR